MTEELIIRVAVAVLAAALIAAGRWIYRIWETQNKLKQEVKHLRNLVASVAATLPDEQAAEAYREFVTRSRKRPNYD